ncbi:DUF2314 domain-containing protein [Chryseobacterium nematophagum]|uniref:DUF2314 domain-containing protein n=1 Tax=Chryseobacterium nematophagum TaxID=2305228 RepID=A0A3M7TEN0_9FLAO|nr:DUF2314 domain-containing protein [Chryseobacterium nematophagum]RNA62053.1 DUF2314 domain-containing protein [Chryseobacterium nematophagum]
MSKLTLLLFSFLNLNRMIGAKTIMATIEVDKEYLYYLYKAENTLLYFIEQIQKNNLNYSALKFKDEHGVYVWLENVEYKNEFFKGVLSETNEKKDVSLKEVIDWMLIEKNRLIGGYTIRHYRNGLSEEERLNFDIDFGLKIDNGNDFFKPDLSTPEGAIIALENFYTEKSLEGVLSCKDFHKEAENILLETRKDVEEELVKKTAELLKLSLIENLQKNGMPDFTNVERVFNRIRDEENKQLIEEKLIYPEEEEVNKFWLAKAKKEWKVLGLVE